QQIVEVAIRALSPGINDAFTAINCIDQLSVCLGQLAGRKMPSPYRYQQGKLRALFPSSEFADFMATAFHQIRQMSQDNLAVMIRLFEAFISIARVASSQSQLQILHHHATRLLYQLDQSSLGPADRADAMKRVRKLESMVGPLDHSI